KLSEGNLGKNQRLWMEFFANREFSQQQTEAISRAEHLLDRNTWTEEERKLIDQLAYSAANHFGELETYFAAGIQKGRVEGRLEIARQMFLEGFNLETIARLTGLSEVDLIDIKSDFE
ncbi:TPA: hypothetical protein ACGO2Y_002073, partial [Streptococcus suis]